MLFRHGGQAGHLEQSGVEVGADDRLVSDRAGLARARPAHDERHPNPALVQPALGAAQRQVRRGVGGVQQVGGDHPRGIAEVGGRHPSVVRVEDDDRVLGQPQPVEGVLHTPQAVVDGGDHRRELDVVLVLLDLDGALGQYPVLLVRGLFQQSIELCARKRLGIVGIALQEEGRAGRRLHSRRLLAVLQDQVRTSFDRVVHGEVRQVEEEGAVPALLDEVDGEVGQSVGEVLVFLAFDDQARHQVRREVAAARGRAGKVGRLHVEALVERACFAAAEVPLAEDRRAVAVFPERFGERHLVQRQGRQLLGAQHLLEGMLPAARQPVRQAQPCRVLAGQERGARGRTDVRRRVRIGEAHAPLGERVDVGRLVERAAEYADVAPAQVVHEEEDDVRRLLSGSRGCRRGLRRTRFGSASPQRRGKAQRDEAGCERAARHGPLRISAQRRAK